MRGLAKDFFSRLHAAHLRRSGYTKERHTFTRELDGFTERIQFQGSSWNSGDSSFRFYVNFGVQFHDLPARLPDRDFRRTHCWARLESIVPEAPAQFDLSGDDDQLAASIAAYVDRASRRVAEDISSLRKRYEETRSPRLSFE